MKRLLILLAVLLLLGAAGAAHLSGLSTGALRVATPGLVLNLQTTMQSKVAGKTKELPIPPAREVKLPVGEHKVSSITLCAQDKQRKVWVLQSLGSLGKLKTVQVAEGQTTVVEGGGPLRVKTILKVLNPAEGDKPMSTAPYTSSPRGSRTAEYVSVRVRYVGKAGEHYGPRVMIGKSVGPPPSIRLCDYDGNVIVSGRYRYGATYGAG